LEAARDRHPEVLKWARTNGCGWDSSTRSEDNRRERLEVVEWAKPIDDELDVILSSGAFGGGISDVLEDAWADMFDFDSYSF